MVDRENETSPHLTLSTPMNTVTTWTLWGWNGSSTKRVMRKAIWAKTRADY